MALYEDVLHKTYSLVEGSMPQHRDRDTVQQGVMRLLVNYTNKHGTSEGFEDYCKTRVGEKSLFNSIKFAYYELLKKEQMNPRTNYKDQENQMESEMRPVTYDTPMGKFLVEAASVNADTNIKQVQKELEAKDTLQRLYQRVDSKKQAAMNLMVEIMGYKDEGIPVPSKIRKQLSRLRTEIQKTDPTWKLDVDLL